MKKTFVAAAFTLLMVLTLLVSPAYAAEADEYPNCPHLQGQHDGSCGYAPAQDEIPCSKPDTCAWLVGHASDCAYRAAVPASSCTHVHTDACKAQAADGDSGASSSFIEPKYYADYDEDVEYVSPDDEKTTCTVVCRVLNVRSTPSIELTRIAKIYRGDEVTVVAWEGNWAKIEWQDGFAFVYGKYIKAA